MGHDIIMHVFLYIGMIATDCPYTLSESFLPSMYARSEMVSLTSPVCCVGDLERVTTGATADLHMDAANKGTYPLKDEW